MLPTVPVPPGVNFNMSPVVAKGISATKRLPALSKANPRGLLVSPVAKVGRISVPPGVNLRIAPWPLPVRSSVDTKRSPNPSNAGVRATYDASSDKVNFTNLSTGNQTMTLSDTAPAAGKIGFLQALGLNQSNQVVGQTASYQITIDDPKIFTRPWSQDFSMKLHPTWKLYEQVCEENNRCEDGKCSASDAQK